MYPDEGGALPSMLKRKNGYVRDYPLPGGVAQNGAARREVGQEKGFTGKKPI
jgi:hypothetical protein